MNCNRLTETLPSIDFPFRESNKSRYIVVQCPSILTHACNCITAVNSCTWREEDFVAASVKNQNCENCNAVIKNSILYYLPRIFFITSFFSDLNMQRTREISAFRRITRESSSRSILQPHADIDRYKNRARDKRSTIRSRGLAGGTV